MGRPDDAGAAGSAAVSRAAARAERALLGSLLVDPEAISRVAAVVGVEDLSAPKLRLVYEAMLALHARGTPPDYVVLCAEMEARGTLDQVGGDGAVSFLVNEAPTSLYVDHYARTVAGQARERRTEILASYALPRGGGVVE